MTLFGLEIKPKSSNGHYVKPHECHLARQDNIQLFNQRIDDLRAHIDTRIDDLKDILKAR